ncbi:structural maintenance of chromosomes protein 6 [Trichogramma pretiosum]|uniref:structural maintenance of chromosomes protein 6 n=1 Tax=Trichogramma pretiosum TaxID=7493 RepID=UPI0006C9C899|nr:structural maintenance of chromosomes protein 6 [Trichogramma pretiosum]XP_014236261.1 structural maintenance of chromosomes protein 6 [Trichogramma pretiosum]XP_023315791.1 structural maintenance of chromosomes protein 6 [Trichogramma pretiosum]
MDSSNDEEPPASQSQRRKRKINNDEECRSKRVKEGDSNSSSPEDDPEHVAGKIKRIFMKNFMCHDAMEVKFNDKINFIVGANGSGKSAILTALTVGLGAKAKATNRGPSIKEFIKKGRNSALIDITITNGGTMAYKHDVYGDKITVVRSISHTSSSYKIKNWRGEIVSTKREELDHMLQFLNIQVENPISVLNQDVSRSFLSSTGSDDKYKLFMKATRLDVIGENYKIAIKECNEADLRLKDAQGYLNESQKDIEDLEHKLNELNSVDELKDKLKLCQNEIKWVKVAKQQKKLLEIDELKQIEEQKLEELKDLEQTKVIKAQKIDSKIESLHQEIAQTESEAADSSAKLNDAKKFYTSAKRDHEQRKKQITDLKNSIQRKEQDMNQLQSEIKKMELESSALDHRRQEAKANLVNYEQQSHEVEATLRTKQTDLMHLEENKRRLENECSKLKMELDSKNMALNQHKQRLNGLKNESNNALSVYGPNMPRLLKRIDEAYEKGKFIEKPVGPLGIFIKIKDQSWVPAVENQLTWGTLSSFCVDNSQDARILNTIMKEIFRGDRVPQVVISKFYDHMHDVSQGCVRSSRFSNLLDAMEISHPVIANSLIDQREVECTILIPTSEEACNIMNEASRVPHNTKRAFTMAADLFFPDPNYRTYGGKVGRPKYLQVSTSQAIQYLNEEISVIEEELNTTQMRFTEVREKLRLNQSEYREVEQQVKKFKIRHQELKNLIDENKEVLESVNNNTLNTFATEVEELERLITLKKEEMNVLTEEDRKSYKVVESARAELKKYTDLAQNLDSRLNPIKDQIKELKDEKNRMNLENQGTSRKMQETKKNLQRLSGEHEQQQRVVTSLLQEAEKECPKISSKRSIGEIEQEMKELSSKISGVERQHGSKEDLIKELNEKKGKHGGILQFACELQRSKDNHYERLKKRKSLYNDMKKEIGDRVQLAFQNALSLRQYKGKINIDHKKLLLSLEVAPSTDNKRPTKDTKALSGGERSYSTVAFILSLWDCTGLPFYFLDEFDVFMDKINRRVIMDILLGFARNKPQCQFTFLTPLDTSHVTADSTITIHRLDAPERST